MLAERHCLLYPPCKSPRILIHPTATKAELDLVNVLQQMQTVLVRIAGGRLERTVPYGYEASGDDVRLKYRVFTS